MAKKKKAPKKLSARKQRIKALKISNAAKYRKQKKNYLAAMATGKKKDIAAELDKLKDINTERERLDLLGLSKKEKEFLEGTQKKKLERIKKRGFDFFLTFKVWEKPEAEKTLFEGGQINIIDKIDLRENSVKALENFNRVFEKMTSKSVYKVYVNDDRAETILLNKDEDEDESENEI